MNFEKVLIANRGEIACRVIESARRMGLMTVAVFSDADAGARHVELADEAVRIGPPEPGESYLRGDAIIAAAKSTGAGGIHPGYGFLSENPKFVEAVEAAGLVFVGPSADAIRAMGLKGTAKALMEKAGIPVVPGYHGDEQDHGHLENVAARIEYPVLIKAVAGGGGKGMRKVARAEEFSEQLQSARAEARTAFGNDDVLIEKFVEKPRHIEVQVFGDGTRAVHLFERDCSLQRRHQKVIEEAPAPGMTHEMREAMGAAAVRAAEAVGYSGAGTVEFIVDASDGLRADRFWFMEMNTRLQVEHPVTEAITGIDLVEWQLRVAMGEALPAQQDDLSISGHAIEARLYAEDAAAGFLPVTGRLAHLRFPESARVDTGVREGDRITPFYDPMIAKLTVHGEDRAAALRSMRRALSTTEIGGTQTNLEFIGRLFRHDDFVAGNLDTGIIERDIEKLISPLEPSMEAKALASVTALSLHNGSFANFTLWSPLRHRVPIGDDEVIVTLRGDVAEVEVEDQVIEVSRTAGGYRIDGNKTMLSAIRLADAVHVFGEGGGRFELPDPLQRGTSDVAGGAILAPMPGKVTAIFVEPGAEVVKGQRLVVLEAMKMEHALRASRDGKIDDVLAREGDQVDAGVTLVVMEELA